MDDISESQKALHERGVSLYELPPGSKLGRLAGELPPYSKAVVIVPIQGSGDCEIMGLCGTPDFRQVRALLKELGEVGYRYAEMWRLKNEQRKKCRWPTK